MDGYDASRFVDIPDENLLCPICIRVFKEPTVISCGHTFCKFCIDRAMKSKQECPLCRSACEMSSAVPNFMVDSLIFQLVVHCRYRNMGCDFAVALQYLRKHEMNCPVARLNILENENEVLKKKIRLLTPPIEPENPAVDNNYRPKSRQEFIHAVKTDELEIAQAGIEDGFDADDKDDNGIPLLVSAASAGYYEMCELLLKNGARPNATDCHRKTALMLAAQQNKDLKICKLLLAHGATDRQSALNGATALAYAAKTNKIRLMRMLISKGFNMDKQDNDGNSILHHVIPCSNMSLRFLINKGANVNAVNNSGLTPLMLACSKKSEGNALVLARAGAKFVVGSQSARNYANQAVEDHLKRNGFTEF